MQGCDDIRVEGVVLAAGDKLQPAAGIDIPVRVPGKGRKAALVRLEFCETGALQPAGGTTETLFDDLAMQSYGLEKLGAPVAGDGRDAHLGEDLVQALVDAAPIAVQRPADGLGTVSVPLGDAEIGQPGMNRRCAEADQDSELVGIAGSTGIDDQVGVAAQAGFDQVVVNGAGRQ